MKKETILAVLLFGGLWGLSEAVLGVILYTNDVPLASVPLTLIAFVILTLATLYSARPGTATLIAAFAMLYKFLNEPFFACHILGILVLGLSYDLFVNTARIRNRSLSAALTVYGSYAGFALMITYLFRYPHWVEGGFAMVAKHVGISGTLAAVLCAASVPIALGLEQRLKGGLPAIMKARLASAASFLLVAGMWAFAFTAYFLISRAA